MVETADSTALHATKVTPRYEKNTRVLVMPANARNVLDLIFDF